MSKRGKVLITDVSHPLLMEGLEQRGYEVIYHPDITHRQAEQMIHELEGIVVTTKIVLNRTVLEKAAKLKFIARAGSGMENIDVAYAAERNIQCINSPEGNCNSVAEHAVGLLIALYHHIPRSFNEIKEGQWNVEQNRVSELEGQTVGIIGYGNTGSAFAEKLSVFGVTVLAYDKYKKNFSNAYANESSMEELFAGADVVSMHVPLTQETTHLVNEKFLNQFHKPIRLINTSRGKVVNTKDLLAAVRGGKVTGAALDVLENENVQSYSEEESTLLRDLIYSGEVIITPHIAGKSFESRKKFAEVLLKKLKD